MPKENKKSFNHLDKGERNTIEVLLKKSNSFQEIANELGKSRQTVQREILRNSIVVYRDTATVKYSCVHARECQLSKSDKLRYCPLDCIRYKSSFTCEKLKKYPMVCNNCVKRNKCNFLQRFYVEEDASNFYHTRFSESHNALKSETSVLEKAKTIIPGYLRKGWSVEAALMAEPNIDVSASTIRQWIDKGVIPHCKSFLRYQKKYKAKYSYKRRNDAVKLYESKLGHRYQDYLKFIDDNPNTDVVQFDTVMGPNDGQKSILTIHLVQEKFQFGFLLEKHTSNEVNEHIKGLLSKLKKIQEETSLAVYSLFVKCWLADNGPEFDHLIDLNEAYPDISIYYTRTYSSSDKAECEKNHVIVRYINPKGDSWDNLTQEDVNKMFSHINSYPRDSLKKKTPYQATLKKFGKEFLDTLGIYEVDKKDVNLTSDLLKTKK